MSMLHLLSVEDDSYSYNLFEEESDGEFTGWFVLTREPLSHSAITYLQQNGQFKKYLNYFPTLDSLLWAFGLVAPGNTSGMIGSSFLKDTSAPIWTDAINITSGNMTEIIVYDMPIWKIQ